MKSQTSRRHRRRTRLRSVVKCSADTDCEHPAFFERDVSIRLLKSRKEINDMIDSTWAHPASYTTIRNEYAWSKNDEKIERESVDLSREELDVAEFHPASVNKLAAFPRIEDMTSMDSRVVHPTFYGRLVDPVTPFKPCPPVVTTLSASCISIACRIPGPSGSNVYKYEVMEKSDEEEDHNSSSSADKSHKNNRGRRIPTSLWKGGVRYVARGKPLSFVSEYIHPVPNGTQGRFRVRFKNTKCGWSPWSEYSDLVSTASLHHAFILTSTRFDGVGTLPREIVSDGNLLEKTLVSSGYCAYPAENVKRCRDPTYRTFKKKFSTWLKSLGERDTAFVYVSAFTVHCEKTRTRSGKQNVVAQHLQAEKSESRFYFSDTNFTSLQSFRSTTLTVTGLARYLATARCRHVMLIVDWSHRCGLRYKQSVGGVVYRGNPCNDALSALKQAYAASSNAAPPLVVITTCSPPYWIPDSGGTASTKIEAVGRNVRDSSSVATPSSSSSAAYVVQTAIYAIPEVLSGAISDIIPKKCSPAVSKKASSRMLNRFASLRNLPIVRWAMRGRKSAQNKPINGSSSSKAERGTRSGTTVTRTPTKTTSTISGDEAHRPILDKRMVPGWIKRQGVHNEDRGSGPEKIDAADATRMVYYENVFSGKCTAKKPICSEARRVSVFIFSLCQILCCNARSSETSSAFSTPQRSSDEASREKEKLAYLMRHGRGLSVKKIWTQLRGDVLCNVAKLHNKAGTQKPQMVVVVASLGHKSDELAGGGNGEGKGGGQVEERSVGGENESSTTAGRVETSRRKRVRDSFWMTATAIVTGVNREQRDYTLEPVEVNIRRITGRVALGGAFLRRADTGTGNADDDSSGRSGQRRGSFLNRLLGGRGDRLSIRSSIRLSFVDYIKGRRGSLSDEKTKKGTAAPPEAHYQRPISRRMSAYRRSSIKGKFTRNDGSSIPTGNSEIQKQNRIDAAVLAKLEARTMFVDPDMNEKSPGRDDGGDSKTFSTQTKTADWMPRFEKGNRVYYSVHIDFALCASPSSHPPCEAPVCIRTTKRSVWLRWKDATLDTACAPLVGYEIFYAGTRRGQDWKLIATMKFSQTAKSVQASKSCVSHEYIESSSSRQICLRAAQGLVPGLTYRFRVRSITVGQGRSRFSAPSKFVDLVDNRDMDKMTSRRSPNHLHRVTHDALARTPKEYVATFALNNELLSAATGGLKEKSGGVVFPSAVRKKMRAYDDDTTVQIWGLRLLSAVASEGDRHDRRRLVKSAVVETVLDAMTRHDRSEAVQSLGASFLGLVSCDLPEDMCLRCLKTLTRVREAFPSHPQITPIVVWATSKSRAAARERMLGYGGKPRRGKR